METDKRKRIEDVQKNLVPQGVFPFAAHMPERELATNVVTMKIIEYSRII
ncbi:hypothetical protein Dpep_2069 [Dethiosulfovibrio peptidovorans DSM 11002]|uniref:Uncharacterized protein n=1 Tax=Dethiosulfovibrio peptidovorans DSM 11002 TaxID=469381 RepID=D2Z2T0_9BACT|nr:hypothetical protein Dpep_2069 [Dethiosulfovibrio peptidovorans DSM 11002]